MDTNSVNHSLCMTACKARVQQFPARFVGRIVTAY